ncbi:MAG: fatty acyl-AMP ligase [Anaerolineae bacterium]|nr:fatty acyl-AMP ligase [Anaerolineae bacterium]
MTHTIASTSIPIRPDHRPATLLEQARWLVEHRPDDTALVLVDHEGDHAVTTRAFFDGAAQYARALEAVGVQPGDLVVLVLQHGLEVLLGFWGTLLLGAVPSIFPFLTEKLDPDRYFASVRALVERSEVRVVITYASLADDLRAQLDGIPTLDAILTVDALQPGGDPAEYWARTPAQADDTAFLQHSSGSTGLQKGVMLSHRSVLNQIASYSVAIRLSPDDVIVSWLPLYHDMGLIAGFILPLMQGIPLVLMSPFHWVRDPKILPHAITRHRGTLCWLPNFAYNFLATRLRDADLEGVDLSSWRAAINCSEPVYAESHRIFVERLTPYGLRHDALATSYAMAENTFAVTQGGMSSPVNVDVIDRAALMEQRQALPSNGSTPGVEMVSCGAPIPGVQIRIVDEQRQPLPERHVGEIALHGDSMLSGYYRHPEATAEALADGWYFTGDMGYLAGGEVYITGRKKDLIIVGGKNIYPQDIENLVNEIPGVHPGRVVAFGVPNERLGTEDIAVIAEVDTTDASERATIMRAIRARVVQSSDVVARYVHLVDRMWLIKTSSGKIARRANREKFLQEVLNSDR